MDITILFSKIFNGGNGNSMSGKGYVRESFKNNIVDPLDRKIRSTIKKFDCKGENGNGLSFPQLKNRIMGYISDESDFIYSKKSDNYPGSLEERMVDYSEYIHQSD